LPSAIGNFFITAIIRSPLHPLLGDSFAIIMVKGRKSGRRIATPINVVRQGDGYDVVSYRSRTWWRNLRGGRTGMLHVGGKTIAVAARIIEDPSGVMKGMKRYFHRYPGYAKYFGIRTDSDGGIAVKELQQVVKDRVMIHLMPEKEQEKEKP
jgi:deazaflavin-dependent oxidoreductase (nitroreductase family)